MTKDHVFRINHMCIEREFKNLFTVKQLIDVIRFELISPLCDIVIILLFCNETGFRNFFLVFC